jgi:solute carrier family 9 (sodium/hydrogen exchanger), member 8
MFCGMAMAKYVRPNLSRSTDDRVGAFFRVIATLAEIFVFVYIGCALFTEHQAWGSVSTWAFIVMSLVALAVSRYLNVYPCTAFVNLLRPAESRIPETHKHMLWFSGLRGAMAFALASRARNELDNSRTGHVILTCTFFMVRIALSANLCTSALDIY